MRILLIDDLRDLRVLAPKYVGNAGYVGHTSRNYSDGIRALREGGWDLLLLDHDLGDFEDKTEKTGYDVMCFLEENEELLPGKIQCVSSNPVGRRKIQQVIDKLYGKN